ncbi:MAG TPA: class I SAM-dependent methyltransferase [Azospirillaceae bacterium]|nr:class I SAM-dependent methyltransferase [Azospirillaceae bacterium]
MTSDWTEGYVVDVGYEAGFQRLLAPSLIDLVLAVRGVRPVLHGRPFTYLELGCGQGFTTNLLAAANPHGQFRGVDFNPGHMVAARELAQAAGIGNATFSADSFAEFLEADTPGFDMIGLHGVWSWISEENRRLVVDIVARKLKLGGVLYMSYNCLPGWAAMIPLRRLVAEQGRALPGPTPARARRMREMFARLGELDARYLQANPAAAARLADLRRRSVPYLAHEYLNRDWHADTFADVMRDLGPARLSWVGSARLSDHAGELSQRAEDYLGSIEDTVFRETARDVLVNQAFRHDVFVRGPLPLSEAARKETLATTRLTLAAPPPEAEGPGKAILDALASGPQPLDRLLEQSDLAALLTLVAQGAVLPAEEADAGRRAATDRFNAVVLDRALDLDDPPALASPVLGSGVALSRLERVFLLGRRRGVADLGQFAWDQLSAIAPALAEERPFEALGGTRDSLAARAQAFTTVWLPALERLGVG